MGKFQTGLVELAGFSLVQANRGTQRGKKRGGDFAVLLTPDVAIQDM